MNLQIKHVREQIKQPNVGAATELQQYDYWRDRMACSQEFVYYYLL